MTFRLLGALLGACVAVGLLTVLRRLPVLRGPSLDDRLAPYLRESPVTSGLLQDRTPMTSFPLLSGLFGPMIREAAHAIERALGGATATTRQLEQAGSGRTLEEFRAEQVIWGVGGFGGALGFMLVLLARGHAVQPVAALLMCALTAVAGVLLRDYALGREVAQREQRMVGEFPTIAELLALAVTAGEGAVGALERVTRLSSGELAQELSRALADARAGASLVQALQGLGARTSLPTLVRFVDGVAVAVERGTPLADVLRAQAVDVREAGKRALLEIGGRKEIGMMIPVVFLILPVTLVFALFPGLVTLDVSG